MTRLALPDGEDHPEAAHKHLLDAQTLLAQERADGAAYLSGYVVECALKAICQLETGAFTKGHDLQSLAGEVSAVVAFAGARTARYFGAATKGLPWAAIAAWRPKMRYRPATMTLPDARAWCADAQAVFAETVAQMKLDGEL
jgi:hypothetical protein